MPWSFKKTGDSHGLDQRAVMEGVWLKVGVLGELIAGQCSTKFVVSCGSAPHALHEQFFAYP